jgi:CRP-like cAMP-binding protein
MSLESDIALLKGVPLFAGLAAEQLRLIAFSAVRLELAKDQVLFRAGTKAQSGFVVLSGKVELAAGDPGRHKTVTVCDRGALIGEMALFVETKRPATATAQVPSEVLEIERKAMLRMLNEYPAVAADLRVTLAKRLSATAAELARVRSAFAPAPARSGNSAGAKK